MYFLSFILSDCPLSIELIGNGICNDETNTINCGFDGFDCCLSDVTEDNCSECSCHSKCISLSWPTPCGAIGVGPHWSFLKLKCLLVVCSLGFWPIKLI